jgi:hypothetical protein
MIKPQTQWSYQACIVNHSQYVQSCLEAAKLLEDGIVRMTFFEGQEAIAKEWLKSTGRPELRANLAAILAKHEVHSGHSEPAH